MVAAGQWQVRTDQRRLDQGAESGPENRGLSAARRAPIADALQRAVLWAEAGLDAVAWVGRPSPQADQARSEGSEEGARLAQPLRLVRRQTCQDGAHGTLDGAPVAAAAAAAAACGGAGGQGAQEAGGPVAVGRSRSVGKLVSSPCQGVAAHLQAHMERERRMLAPPVPRWLLCGGACCCACAGRAASGWRGAAARSHWLAASLVPAGHARFCGRLVRLVAPMPASHGRLAPACCCAECWNAGAECCAGAAWTCTEGMECAGAPLGCTCAAAVAASWARYRTSPTASSSPSRASITSCAAAAVTARCTHAGARPTGGGGWGGGVGGWVGGAAS